MQISTFEEKIKLEVNGIPVGKFKDGRTIRKHSASDCIYEMGEDRKNSEIEDVKRF